MIGRVCLIYINEQQNQHNQMSDIIDMLIIITIIQTCDIAILYKMMQKYSMEHNRSNVKALKQLKKASA